MSDATRKLTDRDEFMRFHLLLTKDHPDYEPHYIRVNAGDTVERNEGGQPVDEDDNPVPEDSPKRINLGKKSAGQHKKITADAAIRRLKRGENVGIEAHKDDDLVIIDVDDPEVVKPSELKPTLTAMSRSRNGYHYFYFATDPSDERVMHNTGISKVGEIRVDNYYTLAPGSWVDTFDIADEIPHGQVENAGKYTIESDAPMAGITFDELPKPFRDHIEAKAASNIDADKITAERQARREARKAAQPESTEDEGSALFELELSDVIAVPKGNPGIRFPNPLHPGGKGKTAGISEKDGKTYLQCFSHSVSHTTLSTLAVLAGVTDCESAGQGFRTSTVGASTVDTTDGRTFWKMWSYAMLNGMLPKDDPVSWNAIRWYAIDRDVCCESDLIEGYKLPPGAVSRTKAIIKSKEGIEIINIGKKKPKQETTAVSSKTPQPGFDVSPDTFLIGDKKAFDANGFAKWLIDDSGFTFVTLSDTAEVMQYDAGVYLYGGEVKIGKTIEQVMNGFKITTHGVNEVIGHIQRRTYTERDEFDSDKRIINLKNGLFDTRTGTLKSHTPDHLSMVQIPITYDPEATCPAIDRFLSDVLDADDINTAIEWFGYVLEPDYWIQKMLMLLGEGENGKSKFLGLLEAFIGEKNCSDESIHQLVNNRFRVANLFGKLANIHADIGDRELRETGILKLLSGGDRITVEKKNKSSFKFRNFARLIFSANRLPAARDDTDAWYRRWTFINFTRKFGDDPDAVKKEDKKILDKLITNSELSGLLNRALKALKGLHERDGFSKNLSTEETRRIYIRLSDPVTTFVEDCCRMDPKATVKRSVLFNAYVEFCKKNRQAPIGQSAFTRRIKDAGGFSECQVGGKDNHERGWRGVTIHDGLLSGNTLGNTLYESQTSLPSEANNTDNTLQNRTLGFYDNIEGKGVKERGEGEKSVLSVSSTETDSDLGGSRSVLPSVLPDQNCDKCDRESIGETSRGHAGLETICSDCQAEVDTDRGAQITEIINRLGRDSENHEFTVVNVLLNLPKKRDLPKKRGFTTEEIERFMNAHSHDLKIERRGGGMWRQVIA